MFAKSAYYIYADALHATSTFVRHKKKSNPVHFSSFLYP